MSLSPADTAALLKARPAVLRYCLSLTRDVDRAEDLLQEAILRVYQNQDKFQSGSNIAGWLLTIARNHFFSQNRRTKYEFAIPDDTSYSAIFNSIAIDGNQESHLDWQDFTQAFNKIPHNQQAVLHYAAIGYSLEEIAQMENVPIGTVKSRVHRARQAVAELLEDTGPRRPARAVALLPDRSGQAAIVTKPATPGIENPLMIASDAQPAPAMNIIPVAESIPAAAVKPAPVCWLSVAQAAKRLNLSCDKARRLIGRLDASPDKIMKIAGYDPYITYGLLASLASAAGIPGKNDLGTKYAGSDDMAELTGRPCEQMRALFDGLARQFNKKGYATIGDAQILPLCFAYDDSEYSVRPFAPVSFAYRLERYAIAKAHKPIRA